MLFNWVLSNLAWTLLVEALVVLTGAGSLFALLRYGFGYAITKRGLIAYWVFMPISISTLIILLMSAIKYITDPFPRLTATIEQIGYGGNATGDDDKPLFGDKVPVFLFVSVKNTGTMASIARAWTITSDISGNKYTADIAKLPKTVRFQQQTWNMTVNETEALYNKALSPIVPGGQVSGVILFLFDLPNEWFKNKHSKFTLSFRDINGDDHISSIETSGKGNDTPAYTPGINEEIQTK